MTKTIYRTFRYRLYPTPREIRFLEQQFSGTRWVYNYFLADKDKHYRETGKHKSRNAQAKELTAMLKTPEYEWLRWIHRDVLDYAIKHLDLSYMAFYRSLKRSERVSKPKLRNKVQHNSFTWQISHGFNVLQDENLVMLPRFADFILGKIVGGKNSVREGIGGIRVVMSRPIEGTVKEVTVKREQSGKYFIMFDCSIEADIPAKAEGKEIAIDLGSKDYVVTNEGFKVPNPKFLQQSLEKLKRADEKFAGTEKGSNNREKQRIKLARLHEKVANQRRDFQHKLALELVRASKSIATETLDIKRMQSSLWNNRFINDAAWGSFLRILESKAETHGVEIKKVERFFPSSKTCSVCETVNDNLKLSDREWVCPCCGAELDRDVNAAQNILRESQKNT